MQLITHKSKIVKPKPKKAPASAYRIGSRQSNSTEKVLALVESVIKSDTIGTSFVPSQTVSGKVYEVTQLYQETYSCDCPGYAYRPQDENCKHIEAVKLYMKIGDRGQK